MKKKRTINLHSSFFLFTFAYTIKKEQDMIIETTIKYYEGYIPPRCRKTRYNEIFCVVLTNIRETTFESLKLAFIDKSENDREVFYYKGKLYSRVIEKIGNTREEVPSETVLENFLWWQKNSSVYYSCNKEMNAYKWVYGDYSTYETKEDVIKRVKDNLKQYLLVDGVLYKEQYGLPFYRVMTFGLGHNHGGTDLCVCYNKKPQTWIKRKENRGYCFSALDFNNAYQKAVAVANGRGDNLSIQYFKQDIIVYMQELFL